MQIIFLTNTQVFAIFKKCFQLYFFRSCFAMTEPAVASSDATNIQASIARDGNEYVLNGRKWWTTGAMHPKAELCIFMGKTDPNAAKHRVS